MSLPMPAARSSPPILYLTTLALATLLDSFWPICTAAGEWLVRLAIATLLLIAGAGLALWSFATLQRHGTSGSLRQPAQTLVCSGPFRHSRNPIYVAQTLLYLGLTILGSNLWAAALLPGLLLVMQKGVIRREEIALRQLFGPAYQAYCEQTRRWL